MMDLQDHAEPSTNEMGTVSKSGAPLTQRRSPDVLRDLLVKRNLVDAESREGRILSNLIKQTAALQTYERPAWATHPMQTLQGMMEWQMKLLAK